MAKKFSKLTRLAMRQLQPGQTIYEHGILFERLPNGDGRFASEIMISGERIRRTIGKESEGVTREQAEEFIEQLRTDARHERLNLPKRRKVGIRFKEAAEKYIATLRETGGSDIERKSRRFELHLTPFFGARPLAKIDSDEIGRYKKQRAEQGASPATINRELAALSHMLGLAVDWKWIPGKPRIRRLAEGPGRIIYLTQEQALRLREVAAASDYPHVWLFIEVGIATSMRRSEILRIRVSDVDVARRIIYVPRAKAGPREQPITVYLAELLGKLLDGMKPDDWLFPSSRSGSGHMEWLETAFRTVVQQAGLDPAQVTRHTLRHTAITHAVQAGIDLTTVQRLSGHETLAMVARYSHQNGAHIQASMDRYEARIPPPQTPGTITSVLPAAPERAAMPEEHDKT